MWLKYGVALVAAVIGVIRTWRLFERERRTSLSDGALLSWDEEPRMPWHIGWTSRSLVAIQWYRRRSVRVAVQLLAVTIPFVLIGLAINAFGFTWGWMYFTFVTPLVAYFGGRLFMQMV